MVITEVQHVSDHKNIDPLIDQIYKKLLIVCLNKSYKKLSLKGNNAFQVKDIINTCDWLGDDNVFAFDFHFGYKDTKVEGKMTSLKDKQAYIEKSKIKNGHNIIHNAVILIDVYVGNGNSRKVSDIVKTNVERKIKSCISHELQHMLDETIHPSQFKLEDDVVGNDVTLNGFEDGYNLVSKLLKDNNFSDENEKMFISLLYLITDKEIKAHKRGFFKTVEFDYNTIGKLKDINRYYEFNKYNEILVNIDNVIQQRFIDKYKNIVLNMYGKKCLDANKMIEIFKPKLKRTILDIGSIYNNIDLFECANDDVYVLREQFKKQLEIQLGFDNLDESERIAKMTMYETYVNPDLMIAVRMLESMLDDIDKHDIKYPHPIFAEYV